MLRDSNDTLISTLTTGMIYNFSTTATFYIMALNRSMTDIQKLGIIVLDKQQLKNNFIYTAPIATNSTVGFVRSIACVCGRVSSTWDCPRRRLPCRRDSPAPLDRTNGGWLSFGWL